MNTFVPKYLNAIGSDNELAQTELVIGGIADLINNKPLTVIQTISAVTNKEFTGKTFGDLTKAVGDLLKTNAKFAAAMTTLVYLNNGLISHQEISNAAVGNYSVFNEQIPLGEAYKNISGGGMDMVSAIVGAVSNITAGGLNLAAEKAKAKGATDTAKLNLETATTQADAQTIASKEGTKQALLQTLGAKYSSMGGLSGTTVLVIVGVLALGVAGIYMLSRNSANEPKPNMPSPPAPGPAAAIGVHQVGGNIITPPVVTPPVIIPPLDGVKTS